MTIDPRNFSLNPSQFSARLAISGDRIAVGQALNGGIGALPQGNSGLIHIFSIQSNSVIKLNTIMTPDTVYDAPIFGNSLGLVGDVLYAGSGNTFRVGAHDGTAYLYKNLSGNPTLVSKWTELPSQWAGYFGGLGCLFADTLVISQGSSPSHGSKAGAFFYRVDGSGNRASVFSFVAPDTDRDNRCIALTSNRCAIVWNSRANSNNCQILVFDIQRDATNGFRGITTNVVIAATGFAGVSQWGMSCDGDLVAMGEPQYAVGTNQCGRVRVWRLAAGSASLISTLTPADSYNAGMFGECVCLKGSTLLVGSPTVPGVSNAQGCVYVYSIPAAGQPFMLRKLQPNSPVIGSGEYFGDPISWDGNRIVVGSSVGYGRTGSGAVYIYSAASIIDGIPQPASAARGSAVIANGFLIGVNLIDGGYGYTNTPSVRILGGGGSGAQAVALVSNGVVTAISVLDAGHGYTSTPVVVIDPPFIPSPALSIAPMSFLTFSNLTKGGAYQLQRSMGWYWANQLLSFTTTGSVWTQMVAGTVGSTDYRLALSPAPSQAFATAQVVNGFLVGATVTSGGSGYGTSPALSIVGGGGTNATAVSYVTGGVVTGIQITSAGIGYTNTPTIRIAAPPAAALSPTVQPVMRLDAASLAPYDNYQVQYKTDLGSAWGNWGGTFAPTSVTNSQYLFISDESGFFRVQHVP